MAVSFLDLLIKSHGQRGSKPNVNKKAPNHFEIHLLRIR